MSPPLVRYLVGRNNLPVTSVAPIHSQRVPDCAIEEVAHRDPYQFRPRLAVIASCLLRQSEVLVRRRPKIVAIELDRDLSFGECFFYQSRCAHVAESYPWSHVGTRRRQVIVYGVLQAVDPIRRFLIGIGLHHILGIRELRFLHLELTEIESSDCLRYLAFPYGHIFATFIGFAYEGARG